ncbi:MAG: tetratricopeptide repeat protein, partial [Candidatus Eremiobacterota bacterium]
MSDKATILPLAEALAQGQSHLEGRQPLEALELLGRARREHAETSTPTERAALHLLTGRALLAAERGTESIAHFKRAIDLAEEGRDLATQAEGLEQLGTALHQRHEFAPAATHFHRAIRLYEKLQDRAGQARNHRNLGGVQVDMNNHAGARASYEQARLLYKEAQDLDGLANSVTNVALLLYRNPGRPAAIAEYRRAMEEDQCAHFLVFNNLGFLLTLDSQFQEGREYLQKAREDLES